MIDLSQLFISTAYAQAAAPQPPGPPGLGQYMNFLPLLVIFAIFYVLIIRPQQKKMDEQGKMQKALQRGDRVVTSGGIHGKVTRVEGDDHVMLEVADNVQIKVAKGHVSALASKTEPAADKANGKT